MSVTAQAVRDDVIAAAPAAPRRLWLRLLFRRKVAVVGAVLVVLDVLVALFAPALARWDPQRLDVKARLSPPGEAHWMGTDDVGRDVWSRVIHGARLSVVVGGAVVIETVFNIPGLGRLIISAVLRRDYPVIQGVVLLIALTYTAVNLLVDLAYLAVDPRVRYQ